jgi:hypothetical protein
MPDYLLLSYEAAAVCQPLFELAGRIATLLSSSRIQSSVSVQASLDDLLGAVYSLIYARHHGYAERNHSLGVEDIRNVRVRATDICASKVRTEGKWTAGYYFNSALFRIAAVYHRVLKTVAGKENEDDIYIKDLLPLVKTQFRSWTNEDWKHEKATQVYRQINKLKHQADGIYQGRAVVFDDAVSALTELLKLIEAWR